MSQTWDKETVINGVPLDRYIIDNGQEVKGSRFCAWWRGSTDTNCSIDTGKNLWKDFVSGDGGTVIQLAMLVEGLDFPTACNELGRRYGLPPKEGAAPVRIMPKVKEIPAVKAFLTAVKVWGTEKGPTVGEETLRGIAAQAKDIMLNRNADDDGTLLEIVTALVREKLHPETAQPEADIEPDELPEVPEFDWDGALQSMTGLAGDIARYAYATAIRPSAKVAIATGIVTTATVLNRSVRDASGNICNLFVFLNCAGGGGKDPLMKVPRAVVGAAARHGGYLVDLFMGGAHSQSGITDELENQPVKTMLLDESGGLFKSIRIAKMRGGSEASISVALRALWSIKDGETFDGDKNAKINGKKQKRVVIDTPCFSFAGAVQPEELPKAFEVSDLSNGLLGRFLLFLEGGRGKQYPERLDAERVIPADIAERVQRVLASQQMRCGTDPDRPTLRTHGPHAAESCKVFSYAPHAAQARNEFIRLCDQRRDAGLDAGRNTAAIWTRANENAMKVALTFAAGRLDGGREITLADYTLARDIVNACYLEGERYFESRVVDDDFDRRRGQVRYFIKSGGANGRTKTQLTRGHFGDSRILERVLEIEKDAGYIELAEVRPNGRSAKVYRITAAGSRAC